MGRMRMSHELRQMARSRESHPSGIMPSLSIVVPVVTPPEQAHEIQRRVIDSIKENYKKPERLRYHVLRPFEWGIKLIDQDDFTGLMYDAKVRPSSADMFNMGAKSSAGLLELLRDKGATLPIPLTGATRYGDDRRKRIVGFSPQGRRDMRSYNGLSGERGGSNPLSLFVAEREICILAVADVVSKIKYPNALTVDPGIQAAAFDALSRHPRAEIVRSKKSIDDVDFRKLGPIIQEAMPSELTFGDPDISLYPDTGLTQPFKVQMRPLNAGDMLLEAA